MIIDFHTHIFPKRLIERRNSLINKEPAFGLIYQSKDSRLSSLDELIEYMDRHEIDISVICSFPWEIEENYRIHNDYILDSYSRYPKRLIPMCSFSAYSKNATKEAERCLSNGARGLGELGFYLSDIGDREIDSLSEIMNILKEHNAPCIIHINEPIGHSYPGKAPLTLKGIFRLAHSFSRNTLIFAHWGGGIFFYLLLKREVKDAFKNIYFDTAASPYLYDPKIYRVACEIVGEDKILFGSDFPLLTCERYLKEMRDSGIDNGAFQKIVYKNAKRVLGI